MDHDPVRVVLLNDTRRDLGHLGCARVMETIEAMAGSQGAEVRATFRVMNPAVWPEYLHALSEADVVVLNGEGTLHHDAPWSLPWLEAAVEAASRGKVVHLINAVWQANPQHASLLAAFSRVFVRESLSAADVRAAGHACQVAPDLSLASGPVDRGAPRSGGLVLDSVVKPLAAQLAGWAAGRDVPFRSMKDSDAERLRGLLAHEPWFPRLAPDGVVPVLSQAELDDLPGRAWVITGRFHGACFCVKAGVPFAAIPSNTHKVEGLFTDAGLPPELLLDAGQLGASTLDAAVERLEDPAIRRRFVAAARSYAERARREAAAMARTVFGSRQPPPQPVSHALRARPEAIRYERLRDGLSTSLDVVPRPVVVCWGTGAMGRDVARALGTRLDFFVDNDPARRGTSWHGHPVLAPRAIDAVRGRRVVVLVASVHGETILQQIQRDHARADVTVVPVRDAYGASGLADFKARPSADEPPSRRGAAHGGLRRAG